MTPLVEHYRPDRACLALFDRANDSFRYLATHGFDAGVGPVGHAASPSESILREVIREGAAVLTVDALSDARFEASESVVDMGIRAVLAAPIAHKSAILGAIYLDSTRKLGVFKEEDLDLLGVVGRLIGTAVANQRAFEEIVSLEKYHSLGVLASGVLHQVRSPLSSILLSADLLMAKLETDPEDAREEAESILRDAKRIGQTINNLLRFARQPSDKRGSFAIRGAVDAVADLLDTRLKKASVQLVIDVPEELEILGNRNALEQVLINLVENALQVLREGKGGGEVSIRAYAEGPDLHLLVSDDGPGIPPEIADRIFDPFFTTKSEGEGTGLGLAVCMDIVQKLDGTLRLDRHATQGATFAMRFPNPNPDPLESESAADA